MPVIAIRVGKLVDAQRSSRLVTSLYEEFDIQVSLHIVGYRSNAQVTSEAK